MTRRGRGEGSVFFHERKKRWCATITTGYDATGKRRRRAVYARTKGELLQRLETLRGAVTAGTLPDPTRITLAALLDRWMATAKASDGHRPSTRAAYTGLIARHLAPQIGGVAVARLTPLAIQDYLNTLETGGVGAAMRTKVFNVLRASLRQAVEWQMIPRSPCVGVKSPAYTTPRVSTFDSDEVRQFLDVASTDRLYPFYVLLATTGMRIGECLGLTWERLDMAKGTVTIDRQLTEVAGWVGIGPPKTPSSLRMLHLTSMAVEVLRAHRKAQLAAGRASPDGLVFTDTQGHPLRRSNVRRRSFYPLLKQANLPLRRLHTLRHAYATMLIKDGAPIQEVSALLGHARAAITLNVYAGISPQMGKDAVDRISRLIGQPTDSLTNAQPRTLSDGDRLTGSSENAGIAPASDVGG